MIKWAILLLPLCLLVTAKEEAEEIPWAIADMALDVNNQHLDYNDETIDDDKIHEEMLDLLLKSHPHHYYQGRRQQQDRIRNSKKIRKQKRVKPHIPPNLQGNH